MSKEKLSFTKSLDQVAGCSATRFLRNRDKKNEKNEGKYLK